MKKIFILFLVLTGILSCQENEEYLSNQVDELSSQLKSSTVLRTKQEKYDKSVRKFAKSLAFSLENKELRKIIKEEADLMKDGDYDVIWKDFKNNEIKSQKKLIKEIIAENSDKENKEKKLKEKQEELDQFGNDFKQLQIAVRGNVSAWDAGNYHPLVACLTSDYYESQQEIEAYDSNGDLVILDANTKPDVPVIVIGINERSDEDGNIYQSFKQNSEVQLKMIPIEDEEEWPNAPTNTDGEFITSGVLLTWNYFDVSIGDFLDYITIEKLSGSSWSIISTTNTVQGGGSFTDTNATTPGIAYQYRIRVKRVYGSGNIYYSPYTSTILITGDNLAPQKVSSMSATAEYPNEVEVRWGASGSANVSGYKVFRRRVGYTNYEQIASLSSYTYNYIDRSSLSHNNEYRYNVVAYNEAGSSEPFYDAIYNPYRNKEQGVAITGFTLYNHHNYERWADGYPEFKITVAYKKSATDETASKIGNSEIVPVVPDGDSYVNQDYTTHWKVSSGGTGMYSVLQGGTWPAEFYRSYLNIYFMEYDGAGWFSDKTFKMGIKVPIREIVDITGEITFSEETKDDINIKENDNCKEFGTRLLRFWDEAEGDLPFGDLVMHYTVD